MSAEFYDLPEDVRLSIIDAATRSAFLFSDHARRWIERGYAYNEEAVERFAGLAASIATLHAFIGVDAPVASIVAAAKYAALPVGRPASPSRETEA